MFYIWNKYCITVKLRSRETLATIIESSLPAKGEQIETLPQLLSLYVVKLVALRTAYC